MKLLIDIGNTRLKFARVDRNDLSAIEAIIHEGEPDRALAQIDLAGVTEVWVASVFDADANRRLTQQLKSLVPRVEFAKSETARAGLRNAYDKPERLGVDRWLAMLALWVENGTACCAVSAGTALTLDLVDAEGRHLGGYIAPGLSTMQHAVLGATRFQHRDARAPLRNAPGRDTEACVREAALACALGMIEHAAHDFPGVRALSGGDAETLMPFLPDRWRLRNDLVLKGLQHLAKAS